MATASTDRISERQPRGFWAPVLCGAVILTIGIGARQSFGIFQKPIAAELGVGRELWSFANALSMLLMGVFSPFVGNIADRFGTARTVAVGGLVYVAGMFTIAYASALCIPIICGAVWDHTGVAQLAFVPIAVCAVGLTVIGASLSRYRPVHGTPAANVVRRAT